MAPRPFAAVCVAATLTAAACTEPAPVTAPNPPPPPGTPSSVSASVVAASAALGALDEGSSYILDFTGTSLPADLAAQVESAGGTLTAAMDRIGVAVAASSDSGFPARAAGIAGLSSVVPDPMLQWIDSHEAAVAAAVDDSAAGDSAAPPPEEAAVLGAFETFRPSQWAPDAISAPAAWGTGALGLGARVAIVDGGIRDNHLDIAPNLDVAHSKSFVPNQPYNFDQDPTAQGQCSTAPIQFWHGTHVAGIVAAPANRFGTVGIAPTATIIGVKVLHCGIGSFSAVIHGIYYAATPIADGGAGANVINLSLGAAFEREAPALAHLANALGKATTYAYQQGVTVVAALGNNAIDFDHTKNLVFFPAMAPHVIAVSATGPEGFGLDSTNFDRPASYTDFGQSAVDIAGPGGDVVFLPRTETCSKLRFPSGATVMDCWKFDLVVAPCRGGGNSISSYCWAAGTSMAAPAVSGVAALIIGKFGPISPSEVLARLRASADDLGKPGKDDFYGKGRVNAFRAVQ